MIGLVGGIGSGKSVVRGHARRARRRGHRRGSRRPRGRIFRARPASTQSSREFGEESSARTGAIDRPKLGALVFSDPREARPPERDRASAHPRRDRAPHRGGSDGARRTGGDRRGGDPARGRLAVAGGRSLGGLGRPRGRVRSASPRSAACREAESDARIARQMTDEERAQSRDVVIENEAPSTSCGARRGLWHRSRIDTG